MEDLLSGVSSGFNFNGMEYRDFRDNVGGNGEEERAPASYANVTANGASGGGRRPPRPPPVAAPAPTHVSRVRTVLLDVKSVHPRHDRADRAALIIEDMKLPAAAVTAIYMLQVEQLLLVTFSEDTVFQEAVTKLRRGVSWRAAGGRHVYGWPTTDSLLQVRLTNVHPDIPVDRLTGLMSQFGRVVLAHRVAGRDPFFPNANDGIVYMKMAIDEGTNFPDFIAVETMDGVLDSIVRVFTDNSLKRCYRCGQLGHIGAFCRRAAKSIADQKDVWTRLQLLPTHLRLQPSLQQPLGGPTVDNGGQAALIEPPAADNGGQEGQAASAGLNQDQEEDPNSFLHAVSPFQLTLVTQQPPAVSDGQAVPQPPQAPAANLSQLTVDTQQRDNSMATQGGLEDAILSPSWGELPLGQLLGLSTSAGPPGRQPSKPRAARPLFSTQGTDSQSRVASRSPLGSRRSTASSVSPSGHPGRQKRKTPATSLSPKSGSGPKEKGPGRGKGRGGRSAKKDDEENGSTTQD